MVGLPGIASAHLHAQSVRGWPAVAVFGRSVQSFNSTISQSSVEASLGVMRYFCVNFTANLRLVIGIQVKNVYLLSRNSRS